MAESVIAQEREFPQAYGVTDEDIRWAESAVADARAELEEAERLLHYLTQMRRQA